MNFIPQRFVTGFNRTGLVQLRLIYCYRYHHVFFINEKDSVAEDQSMLFMLQQIIIFRSLGHSPLSF